MERLAGDLAARWPGKPAARLLGPSARKARTNDRGSRAPTAPTWAVAHRSLSPPMDWGECSQDTVAPTRFPPLVTPEPGTRGAACACRARPAVCGARPAVCGARLALEGVLQPWASTQACAGNPVARLPRPMCQASCRTSQLGLPPHSCPGTPSPTFGTGTAQMEQPETGSAAHPDADAQW